VDQLYALAPLEGQVRLELKLLATLIKCDDIDDLRALASSTGSRAYHNIQSSATIKAARLQGQRLRWAANVNSQALKCDRLALKRERIWEGKDIGMYEGRRVLIEWKMCSGELSFEESTNRIVDIARLLYESSHSRPNDLITLDCLGYMQDNRTSPSIGLVYVLPTMPFQEAPKSLHQLLLEKESDGTSWPALERRRTLAYLMARVVFQLHVVGWLHKGIRPQNVVFVDNAKNLKSPYLIGFDYARRGEESEKTEQTDLAFDLYRHPHAQGEARSRYVFRRQPKGSGLNPRLDFRHHLTSLPLGSYCLKLVSGRASKIVAKITRGNSKSRLELRNKLCIPNCLKDGAPWRTYRSIWEQGIVMRSGRVLLLMLQNSQRMCT
jgi:hypothetical protein